MTHDEPDNDEEEQLVKLLKLGHVKRWAIVDMTKEQTVADHSFRVVAIAMFLVQCLEVRCLGYEIMRRAFFHDLEESETGDMPSTNKPLTPVPIDKAALIVKIADIVEAIIYAQRYAVRPDKILEFLEEKLRLNMHNLAVTLKLDIDDIKTPVHRVINLGNNYD